MFSFIAMIIIGFFAGLIARAIHPGDDSMSWLWTILLGIGGSLIAGMLGRVLGLYRTGEPAGFIMSVLGAVLLLFIYNFIQRKRISGV